MSRQSRVVAGGKRQSCVAISTADLVEDDFTEQICAFYRRIIRNYASWDGQRCLKHGNRSQISGCQFVGEAISIGIGIESETLFRLHAVVMVESVVSELPERNYVAYLMQGSNDQAWRSETLAREAWGGQALNLRGIPCAIGIVGQSAERNAFRY